jgi:hypothetical protein
MAASPPIAGTKLGIDLLTDEGGPLGADIAAQEPPPPEEYGPTVGKTLAAQGGDPNLQAWKNFQQRRGKGKGGKGPSSYIEAEITPPVPGEYIAAQQAYERRLTDWRSIDYQARAATFGLQADIFKDLGPALEKNYEETMGKVNQLLTQAETEVNAIDELIDAARSNRINPGQFFANVGDAGRFASAIAVGVGAMSAQIAGGPNVAYQIIDGAIERNVRAQILNQENDRSLIGHQMNVVNSMRGLADDWGNYGNYVRLALLGMAQAQIAEAQAGYAESQNQIMSRAVYDMFGAKMVNEKIKALQNIKFKVHIGYQNMRKANQAMSAMQSLMKMAAEPETAPGMAPAESAMRRRGAMGPAQARPSGLAQQVISQVMRNQDFATQSPEQQAKYVASEMQRLATQQGISVTEDDLKTIASEVSALSPTRPENQARIRDAILTIPPEEAAGMQDFQTVEFHVPYVGRVPIKIRDPEMLKRAGAAGVSKAQMSLNAEALHERLFELVQFVNLPSNPVTGDIIRRGPNGQILYPQFEGMGVTEIIGEIDSLSEQLLAMGQEMEPGRNALNTWAEIQRQVRKMQVKTSTFQELRDLFGGDSAIRQARIRGAGNALREVVKSNIALIGAYIPEDSER